MEKDKIKLVKPSKEYERQAIEYKEEHFKNGEKKISACSKWYKIADYDEWLKHLENNSKKETVEENCSVATTFFGVRESDNKIVGMIDIRHELINDFLRNYAGHIGYGVRPSERRKGYATQMLSLALKYCKDELKLKEVMISCDKENEGSRKTILNAGGKLEKEYIAENGENVQLYWIELNPIMKQNGIVDTLETERLILRDLRESDAESAFKNWTCDDDVSRYVSWSTHKNVDETREYLRGEIRKCKEEDYYTWGIVLKENQELIGAISAFDSEEGRKEIGYNITKKYWRNGYTTEALKEVMRYLIEDIGIKKFICKHAELNPASGAVMRKAGFKYVKDTTYEKMDGSTKFKAKVYFLDVED